MKSIHWFEAKQLDRVTNFSTEVEIIKAANKNKIPFKYYCTFSVSKKYFDLDNNTAHYQGVWLPFALKKKYPTAAKEFGWHYLFPSARLSQDSHDNDKVRRHHIDESSLQK